MKDLRGKIAVITGGASGIGFAMAECFGRHGMKIVIADIEKPSLDIAVRRLDTIGIESIGVVTDVSDWESVNALAATTYEHFGTAHVICNNAGVGPGGVTWELPINLWRWVLDVDLWGVIHGIRAFVPRLIEQGEGHVVNTASVAGLLALPGMAPYSAAKHAVIGLSQSLQQDLDLIESAVKVSVVCPSMTRTRMNESGRNWPSRFGPPPVAGLESWHPETRASYYEKMEKEALEPEEVASRTLSAVLQERFWVITDSHFKERFSQHYARILEQS